VPGVTSTSPTLVATLATRKVLFTGDLHPQYFLDKIGNIKQSLNKQPTKYQTELPEKGSFYVNSILAGTRPDLIVIKDGSVYYLVSLEPDGTCTVRHQLRKWRAS
jgi:hypothetical protein